MSNQLLQVSDNEILYSCDFWSSGQDTSWKLALSDIALIGRISRMNGDDDSDFLLFLNDSGEKHFLNMTYSFPGREILIQTLVDFFEIQREDILNGKPDSSAVVFPVDLAKKEIYRKSFQNWINRGLAIIHVADGEFSEGVLRYLNGLHEVVS